MRGLPMIKLEIHLNSSVVSVRTVAGDKLVDLVSDGNRTTVVVDAILAGTGRVPNVEGVNLEGAFVKYDTTGVVVNDFLQTTNTRIYAAGDVCVDRKFAHAAEASSPTLAPGSRR